MNSTYWLLVALIATLLLVLVILWVRARLCEVADVLEYRTADYSTIESDTRKLQRRVPNPPSRSQNTSQPVEIRAGRHAKMVKVRAHAVAAALRDVGQAEKSSNPYPINSEAHRAWAGHYERVTNDQMQAHAELADAVQTRALPEA